MKPRLFFLFVILLLLPATAIGQQNSCQLQEIKVEPVANGLQVRLLADGLIEMSCNPTDVRNDAHERLTFRLNNMRGGIASLVEIGRYPLSHLEFSLPPDAEDGVGLLCTLVFYRDAQLSVYGGGEPYDWDDTSWAPNTVPQVAITATRQRNEILLMITSDKPVVAERSPSDAKPQLSVTGTRQQMTLHAVNTDMHAVLDALAQQAGVSVLLDDTVKRSVTAHLEALPFDDLLQKMATAYGLSLTMTGDAYSLAAGVGGGATGYQAAEERTITLNNISPRDARALLPDALLPYVRPNTDANAVTLSGSPAILDKMQHDLRILDQPSSHCLLRAWIISCEDGDNALRDLFAEYAGGNTKVALASSGDVQMNVGTQQADELLVKIRALATRKKMRVEAEPSVQVSNGKHANLFVGQKIYFWRIRDNGDIRLSSVEAGTQLDVTPRASGDIVTVDVTVTNDYLSEINALGPLVMRRSVRGTVRVAAGDTIIVGGLRLRTQEQRHGKPVPGAWPLDQLVTGKDSVASSQEVWVLLQAQTSFAPLPPANAQSEGVR